MWMNKRIDWIMMTGEMKLHDILYDLIIIIDKIKENGMKR